MRAGVGVFPSQWPQDKSGAESDDEALTTARPALETSTA